MAKTKVAIIRCESYDEDSVYIAVKRGVSLIGGLDKVVRPGEKVLLKPNVLAGDEPEKAVTTHPSVFKAVARLFLDNKNIVYYGDSPGFESPKDGLERSGIAQVARVLNLRLGDFDKGRSVDFNDGIACKRFDIVNAFFEVDALISIPKMKSHMLTRITGAVKNQFGCVVGKHKAAFHVKVPNPVTFSKMLIDLNRLLKPWLFIMDGIVAMEGNGPRSGEPVPMNCLIISTDPVAVDATFCRMVGLEPGIIPTIKFGRSSGLGRYKLEEIEYVGDDFKGFIKDDFKIARTPLEGGFLKKALPSFVRRALYAKPIINAEKCVKCGICVNVCPVDGKALNFGEKGRKAPPVYDYSKCIRCYCCQEMCPQKAIYVEGHHP